MVLLLVGRGVCCVRIPVLAVGSGIVWVEMVVVRFVCGKCVFDVSSIFEY